MIRINLRPRENVLGTNISNWTAGHNPVVYTLKREDFKILKIESGLGDKAQITFFEDVSSLVKVGDSIYVNSGDYDTIATIVSILNGGKDLLTNINFVNPTSTGYANIKQLYSISVDFYDYETDSKKISKSLRFTGDIKGNIEVDFSKVVQSFFEYSNDLDYTETFETDKNNAFGFYIKVIENYKNKPIDDLFVLDDYSNPTFVSNSAKQFQDEYGQNLGDYLTFPELYPAQIFNDVFSGYFSYSSKHDLVLTTADGYNYVYVLDYKTGSVIKEIPLTGHRIIDCFDDFNLVAFLNGSDIIFIDLDDLVLNDTITIVQTFVSYNQSFNPRKIGNFLYCGKSGSPNLIYQIDVSDFSVKTLSTNKFGTGIAQYNDVLVLSCYIGGNGIMFINPNTMTEISFLSLGVFIFAVNFNQKGELYFYDATNKKIKKITNAGVIIQSDYTFDMFVVNTIVFVDGVQNKFFMRDTGKIIAFDIDTLEVVTTYENIGISSSVPGWDFKTFKSYIGTGMIEGATQRFLLLEVYQDKLAKYLTPFNTVPYWSEFPFDLSYIYSEKLGKYQTFKRDVFFDRANNQISTIDTNIPVTEKGNIIKTRFKDIPENACFIETQIINSGKELGDYDANDYSSQDYNV